MTNRRFAPRCAECHQKTMAIATVPYSIQIDHDGKKYDVEIPALSVPKCSNCGAISIDKAAGDQIDEGFHKHAGLLTGKQIREFRNRLQLDQQEFANRLGVASTTVSRWETGAQIQQRSLDRFMRLFFGSEQVRRFLGNEPLLATLGLAREPEMAVSSATNMAPPGVLTGIIMAETSILKFTGTSEAERLSRASRSLVPIDDL